MTRLVIDVFGEDVAALHVKQVGARALDMRPAMMRLRELLQEGTKRQFASQGSYFGSSWPPLSPQTKGGSSILVRSGALRSSLAGGSGGKSTVTRSGVAVGTGLWYAHFAHAGTERQPARRLIGVSKTDLVRSKEILENYLANGLI